MSEHRYPNLPAVIEQPEPKRGRGAPGGPDMDEPRVRRLLRALDRGHYLDTACRLASLPRTTVRRWISQGKTKPKGNPYREFRDAVKCAREAPHDRAVETVMAAIEHPNPFVATPAAFKWLRIRDPLRWSEAGHMRTIQKRAMPASRTSASPREIADFVKALRREERDRQQVREACRWWIAREEADQAAAGGPS